MKNLKFKQIMFVLFFVVLATTLVACKSASVVPPTTTETITTKTVKEIIRDTIFLTKKDSSYYKAYIECVNGKPVISKPKMETRKGNHLQPPKVDLKDNVLTINCFAEAQKLFYQWKDIYIKEHQQIIQKVPYPVPADLSWWQQIQIVLGRIFLFLAVLLGIGIAVKNRI